MGFLERGTETKSPAQLAETASKYFIKASIDRPASVTAQAATIALLAIENQDYLPSLREALLKDPHRIQRIATLAEQRHRKNLNGPASLTTDEVTKIIREDFFRASEMIILLPAEKIRHLAGAQYFHEKEKGDSAMDREARMNEVFYKMVARPPQA